MRDDFQKRTIESLAKRVGYICSNPACQTSTSGPHTEPARSVNVGVAAHITAASAGGPRFNANLTSNQRQSIGNGIWLCQTCAKLVDSDESKYTPEVLAGWKEQAERAAKAAIEGRAGQTDRQQRPDEECAIRFSVDDWMIWREEGNRPGDVLHFISQWKPGDIRYSCVIRLRNDLDAEEQLHRPRLEFRRGERVVLSDDYAFGDQEVTLPPRRWVSLNVNHGLHDEATFIGSDSVWFTAETIGKNVKVEWRLTDLETN